jgi:Tol biopolymer transport system component
VQVRRDARVSASPVVLSRARSPAPLSATLLGASSHAGIVATLQGTEFTTTTAADGSFSFRGVPDGTYSLSLRSGTYEELIPNVVFQRGEAFVDMGVLVPLAPIVMVPAKRLSSGSLRESYFSSSPDVGVQPPPPFLRTPDGSQFVFLSNPEEAFENFSDLRMVPLAGGAPLVLAPNVAGFRLSADGTRVVYLQANGSLYSRALGPAGTSTLLAVLSTNYGGSRPFMFSPDGSRVVFHNNGAVYSVSSTGGPVTLLGPGGSSSSSLGSQEDFGVFSGDGNRFFFGAGSSFGSSSGYSGFRVADLRNGVVQTIVSSSANYQVTPDRNVAVVHSRDYDKNPLLLVQLTASGMLSPTVDTQVEEFRLSPDGSLLAWRTTSGAVKVMTMSTGTTVQLSSTSPLLQFSPDGKRLLFTESMTGGTYTLNSIDVAKGDKKPLWNGPLTVNHAWYSADGTKVFFQTPVSAGTGGSSGLYNPTLALNVVDALGGSVRALGTTLNNSTFTATGTNSTKAIYLASSNRVLLFSDTSSAPRTLQMIPINLSGSIPMAVTVDDWELLSDGARVLFLVGGSLRLAQVSDGTSRPVAELVRSFRMSPDGSKVFHVDINGMGRVTTLATNETRQISDRVVQGYWLDNGQLAFVRSGSSGPSALQNGLYLAPVP